MDRKKIGTILLIVGILAWPVGFALKATLFPGIEPVPDILVPHLLGIIPGVILRGSKILDKIRG